MAFTRVERERITDSQLKIQSVANYGQRFPRLEEPLYDMHNAVSGQRPTTRCMPHARAPVL